MTTLDDLELELRKLPGVRATGFSERDDVLLVQIHVGDEETEPTLPLQATRIAYRHSDRPVAVELVRWRTRVPPAPRTARNGHGTREAPPAAVESPAERPAAPGEPAPSAGPESAAAVSGHEAVVEPPEHVAAQPAQVDAPPERVQPPEPVERVERVERVEPSRPAEPAEPTRPAATESTAPRPGAPTPGPGPETAAGPGEAPPATGAGTRNRRGFGEPDQDRVRLLAVLTFPDTDELEVHLTLDGRRTIGRAAASRGLLAAVEATLDALRSFVPDLGYEPAWARTLETGTGEGFLVAAGLTGAETEAPRHGLASGSSAIEAAARATLQALNRSIALELAAVRAAAQG